MTSLGKQERPRATSSFDFLMPHPTFASNYNKNEEISSQTNAISGTLGMLPVDTLGIHSFQGALTTTSDDAVREMFGGEKVNPQPFQTGSKKESQLIPSMSLEAETERAEQARESVHSTNVEHEIALLEKVLKKDEPSAPSSPVASTQDTQDKNCPQSVLEAEMFYRDVFGDDMISPHQFTPSIKNEENLRQEEFLDAVAEVDSQRFLKSENPSMRNENRSHHTSVTNPSLDSVHTDTNLSSALASLVYSNSSNDLEETNMNEIHIENTSGGLCLEGKYQEQTVQDSRTPSMNEKKSLAARRKIGALRQIQNSVSLKNDGRIQKRLLNPFVVARTGKDKNTAIPLKSVLTANFFTSSAEDELCESIPSPISDSSMSNAASRDHSDSYNAHPLEIQRLVASLCKKISRMPRRKLRDSLAAGISLEEVEPLMCINRDKLADMLGLGVTTWKMFVHNTLCIPRWPARALKSQQVREQKMMQKIAEAEERGDYEQAERMKRELERITEINERKRKLFRKDAMSRATDRSKTKRDRKSTLMSRKN